jgi:hypothetical protein
LLALEHLSLDQLFLKINLLIWLFLDLLSLGWNLLLIILEGLRELWMLLMMSFEVVVIYV